MKGWQDMLFFAGFALALGIGGRMDLADQPVEARTAPVDATRYQATVVELVDGDTLVADVVLWPERHHEQRMRVTIRLEGINAAEVRHAACPAEAEAGLRALAALEDLAPEGTVVVLSGVGGARDKYGRVLGHVETAGGIDLGHALVSRGLAVAYDGRGRKPGPWCREEAQ